MASRQGCDPPPLMHTCFGLFRHFSFSRTPPVVFSLVLVPFPRDWEGAFPENGQFSFPEKELLLSGILVGAYSISFRRLYTLVLILNMPC